MAQNKEQEMARVDKRTDAGLPVTTAPTVAPASTAGARDGRVCAWCPMTIDSIAASTHQQIAAVLRDVVEVNGSQKEAARVMCISPQYLNDLLRGRREISAEVAETLQFRRVVVYVARESHPPTDAA